NGLADDERHLDLVVQAAGGRRRPRAGEEDDLLGLLAVAVVEQQAPAADDDLARRPGGYRRRREALRLEVEQARRDGLLHEALPDQRRERPAGDRLAVELALHRDQPPRIADPNRGHELRRVADEPGVAVVRRRPGLAGDGPIAESRARPGPGLYDMLEQEVDDRRLVRVELAVRHRHVEVGLPAV